MCACTYTYMTSLVKASYWQEPFLNYWGVPNARIHLKHMVHTHTHTHRCSTYMLKLTVTNTHALMAAADAANDNVKSAQLLRRLIWLPFCLPLSNALCHTAYPPPTPPKKTWNTYMHTHTLKHSEMQAEIMKIQPYAADLSSSFFSSWQTHPHMHAHTCTHRGNPSPAFRPSLQPWHAVEEGRRPHLENRRGLLLCFDGELTPGVACSFSAKARMKEEQKVSHTLQYTLAKIPLLCFFSFPYHGELLRGGLCCKQCWGVWCYIGWRNIFG